jgi:hypothetical protein
MLVRAPQPLVVPGARWMRPGRLPSYDGAKPGEAALLDWFWSRYTHAWEAAAYNVRVGHGRPVLPNAPDELKRDWQMSTQLRIDALLWKPDLLCVLEVKEYGDAEAFGQAYLYALLLRRTYGVYGTIAKAVLCYDVHPDLVKLYVEHGIALYVVQPLSGIARQYAEKA